MDELDKIRRLLDSTSNMDKNFKPGTEIRDLIRKRSLNAIERLQRNILIELIVGVLAVIVLIVITIHYPFRIIGLYLMFPLIYAALSFIYLGWKYNGMRKLKVLPYKNIKTYLENMLGWISNFSIIYFRLNLVLMPFAILMAIIIALNVKNGLDIFQSGIFDVYNPALIIAALVIYTAIISLISYPVLKWYTGKMFGNHIARLRNSLNELQDPELNANT